MKIPVTDKFLCDLYKLVEGIHHNADIILKPRNPYKFSRRIWGDNPIFQKYREDMGRKKFNNLMHWLKKNNLIKADNLKGKKAIMLTKSGMNKVIRNRFKTEKLDLKKRRDGKWIMIMFDIPQHHKKSRNLLRSILTNLGYKMFQHSVWVTSYDVSEKTEELLQWYSFDKYVKVFLIEKI